jgi:predicted peptidase
MAQPDWRKRFPCFVIVPQCRNGRQWVNAAWGDRQSTPLADQPSDNLQMASAVLDQSLKTLPVDSNRIYLTGLSMGGYGSWELAMRRPKVFAAVAPVCGGGDESQAARLKGLPIWAAHGDADRVVWPDRSRRMVEAVKQAGGHARYTEYSGVGHNSWTGFYADTEGVVPWLFRQKLKAGTK